MVLQGDSVDVALPPTLLDADAQEWVQELFGPQRTRTRCQPPQLLDQQAASSSTRNASPRFSMYTTGAAQSNLPAAAAAQAATLASAEELTAVDLLTSALPGAQVTRSVNSSAGASSGMALLLEQACTAPGVAPATSAADKEATLIPHNFGGQSSSRRLVLNHASGGSASDIKSPARHHHLHSESSLAMADVKRLHQDIPARPVSRGGHLLLATHGQQAEPDAQGPQGVARRRPRPHREGGFYLVHETRGLGVQKVGEQEADQLSVRAKRNMALMTGAAQNMQRTWQVICVKEAMYDISQVLCYLLYWPSVLGQAVVGPPCRGGKFHGTDRLTSQLQPGCCTLQRHMDCLLSVPFARRVRTRHTGGFIGIGPRF